MAMFSTWFATLGAALPAGIVVRRRTAVAEPSRLHAAVARSDRAVAEPAAATVPLASPAVPARPRVVDPIDLRVVPFIPSDNGSYQRRVHPRILSPFRAFPRRGADLYDLMYPRDPRD